MPLNMKDLESADLKDDEIIDPKHGKFIITADIPEDVIEDLGRIGESKNTIKDSRELLKKLLTFKNDEARVNDFVASLGSFKLMKVVKFVAEYLRLSWESVTKKEQPSEGR